jgi:hypothetical protein
LDKRLQGIARGFAILIVSLVGTLLALEVVLRTTHLFGARLSWSQPDPLIGFRFAPDRPYWSLSENDHPIVGRINSFGWRDRPRDLVKPPGSGRVAFLGDSFVEAIQVETDATFVAIAEYELTARLGKPVEILNFGRSGATQTEELLILKNDVMKFSPDLVVVLFNPENDIGDVAKNTTGPMRPFFQLSHDGELILDTSFTGSRAYRVRAAISGIKQRSALVSFLSERYNVIVRSRAIARSSSSRRPLPAYLTLCTSHPDPTYAENYELNKRLIREMAEHSDSRGVDFMLVCGDIVYTTEEIDRYTAVDATFDPEYFEKDLADFAASLGVHYLGLQTPFREHVLAGGGPLHWEHYNYAGHRVVARVLIEKLERVFLESPNTKASNRGVTLLDE